MISFGSVILSTGSGAWLKTVPTPNPLNLPPFTMRVQYALGTTPMAPQQKGATVSRVTVNPNVWDVTFADPDWASMFWDDDNLLAVLGANMAGVTNMRVMFGYCENLQDIAYFDTASVQNMNGTFTHAVSLRSIPEFMTPALTSTRNMFDGATSFEHCPSIDTSHVTDMAAMFANTAIREAPELDTSAAENMVEMFYECRSLKHVPLYATGACIDMRNMFFDCWNVEGGALALYTQASTQAVPPTYYRGTFYECGKDTASGAAELAQIPYDWRIPEGFQEI